MREKKSSRDMELGEIRLRQTAQVTISDQVRTLEIAVTLPAGASPEEIAEAMQQAEIGMSGLSEQLDRHIDHLRGALAQTAPVTAISAAPSPTTSAPTETPTLTMGAFLKAASALGFQTDDLAGILGITSLTGIDLVSALARLHAIVASNAAPGFAEESANYSPEADDADAGQFATELGATLASLADLDEFDEPDFGIAPEDDDGAATATATDDRPSLAEAERLRQRGESLDRLRTLRALRGEGPPAPPEMRQRLFNCVIEPLGKEQAQALIMSIWNPAPGEKLNAARTRALVDWGLHDDMFVENAAIVIELAQAPSTVEG